MEICRNIDEVKRDSGAVLTVGTFDGLHLGHQFIMHELKSRAQQLGTSSTVVTFDPHPKIVLSVPDAGEHKVLTTIDEKIEGLRQIGLDRVVILQFDKRFSQTPSDEFVEDYLFKKIGFQEFVIGYDHGFGKNRKGSASTLRQLAERLQFKIDELPEYKPSLLKLNSTTIRRLIADGKVSDAAELLGYHYLLSGHVEQGEGRGRILNFPTANLALDVNEKLVPGDGVYAVYVKIGPRDLKGMMNIGSRPTFNGTGRTLEVHLFDFDENIYGQQLTVRFVDRIRAEKAFPDTESLVAQLNDDRKKSLIILENASYKKENQWH